MSDYADPGVPLKIQPAAASNLAPVPQSNPILQPLGNVSSIRVVMTSDVQAVIPIFMFKEPGRRTETATGPNFIQKYKLTLDIALANHRQALTR